MTIHDASSTYTPAPELETQHPYSPEPLRSSLRAPKYGPQSGYWWTGSERYFTGQADTDLPVIPTRFAIASSSSQRHYSFMGNGDRYTTQRDLAIERLAEVFPDFKAIRAADLFVGHERFKQTETPARHRKRVSDALYFNNTCEVFHFDVDIKMPDIYYDYKESHIPSLPTGGASTLFNLNVLSPNINPFRTTVSWTCKTNIYSMKSCVLSLTENIEALANNDGTTSLSVPLVPEFWNAFLEGLEQGQLKRIQNLLENQKSLPIHGELEAELAKVYRRNERESQTALAQLTMFQSIHCTFTEQHSNENQTSTVAVFLYEFLKADENMAPKARWTHLDPELGPVLLGNLRSRPPHERIINTEILPAVPAPPPPLPPMPQYENQPAWRVDTNTLADTFSAPVSANESGSEWSSPTYREQTAQNIAKPVKTAKQKKTPSKKRRYSAPVTMYNKKFEPVLPTITGSDDISSSGRMTTKIDCNTDLPGYEVTGSNRDIQSAHSDSASLHSFESGINSEIPNIMSPETIMATNMVHSRSHPGHLTPTKLASSPNIRNSSEYGHNWARSNATQNAAIIAPQLSRTQSECIWNKSVNPLALSADLSPIELDFTASEHHEVHSRGSNVNDFNALESNVSLDASPSSSHMTSFDLAAFTTYSD
ncbi:hypothetical protein CANCADRAFT_31585 [Tortispora caseinolytica NRRL Y-17796]|uniref:Uncharacterized protein n=1 Tax=Tortispora caseinolytica NRRL Y-17796 TaxID=767744 RepID=A0A1E4TG10_9ASCO|nr:hypothetical protein CANCADRAFT_31585 [Tortispora caseinolytica NRRL Y-17796]